jgi:hypothetical protein
MKIYQIVGKQYAAPGDELYEKVPEFSPSRQLTVDEELSAHHPFDRMVSAARLGRQLIWAARKPYLPHNDSSYSRQFRITSG